VRSVLLVLALARGGDDPQEVVGRIGEEEFTLEDVESVAGPELEKIEIEYQKGRHALLEKALRSLVEQELLKREMARTGKTPDVLLDEEVESKISVGDADVDRWYAENESRLEGRTKESIAPQIRRYLIDQARANARRVYFERLEAANDVSYLLEPFRVEIETDGEPFLGPAGAPVTLVEFSDFECPFCGKFNDAIRGLHEAYPDQVRIVFRQFPLPIHPNARKAAEASLCAFDQERFWPMHDLLFAESKALGVPELKEKARRLGLDGGAFDACLDSGRHEARVEEDVQAGVRIGVTGTPAVFINGRPLSGGAVPLEELKEEIARELSRRESR
jgi:predicted DsbA family dithiol-disulfide isomerase